MSGKRYTDDDWKKVRRLYVKEKWSVAEISRQEGLPSDPKTIRRWLQEMKVKIRSPRETRIYPREKILRELKKKNADRSEIQRKYGCSAKFLSLLARGNIKP